MGALDDAAATFLLTRAAGRPVPHRPDLHAIIRREFGDSHNLVIEDAELGFSLLLGFRPLTTPLDQDMPRQFMLRTSYTDQAITLPLTAANVQHELEMQGFLRLHDLYAMAPGGTLVLPWRNQVVLAFQRLSDDDRWAKRIFPVGTAAAIPLDAFLDGFAAARHGVLPQPESVGPHSHPLLKTV